MTKSLFTWGEISRGAGISWVPELSRCARVSLFWKLVGSHETGITRRPRYLAWTTRVTRLTETTIIHVNALHRGAGTTSTVMRITSIRTWKPTWWKLQVPNVNTHNMQEEIHLIDIESIEKTDKTKFLLNTMHLVRLKYNFPENCYGGLK